jgi:acetyltransferase-like isoleucine patch superfamily enzyme
MTNEEKMKAGMWYDANYDPLMQKKRREVQYRLQQLNSTDPRDIKAREEAFANILGYLPDALDLVTPFYCDYGTNVILENNVFINLNCYFMDGAEISIGSHTFIGPSCGFYTAAHPMTYAYRNQGYEKALPIFVGKNCWFGAGVMVLPGVHIGDGCVIAAGAVVTKDIPENSLAAGVPARIIRHIDQTAEELK